MNRASTKRETTHSRNRHLEGSIALDSTKPIHEQPKSGDERRGAVLEVLPTRQPLVHIRRGLLGHVYE